MLEHSFTPVLNIDNASSGLDAFWMSLRNYNWSCQMRKRLSSWLLRAQISKEASRAPLNALNMGRLSYCHALSNIVVPYRFEPKEKYLGTELSYGQFELQTWHQRLKAGRSAFARLRCWFKNRQFLLVHRLYLWKTCVHTILTYGLCATQVSVKILHEYQQTIYQMMNGFA